MKFCSRCGETVTFRVPDGDNRERFVCDACTTIHYQNPRVVTGCLVTHEHRVLLAKRAIEPRAGFWTLPAGFLENGETASAGAARETLEEANAHVEIGELYTTFSLPHISQIYCFFLATLPSGQFSAGVESLEVGLFAEDEVPWDELAFPVIHKTLEHYFSDRRTGEFKTRYEDLIIHRKGPLR